MAVETIAGMQGTGRKLAGPGFDLVEVVNDGGGKLSALIMDPAHRDHPSLHGDLEFGLGFMQQPDVTGLARLQTHSPDEGAFVYPTGTVWTVAEVVRELASAGEVAGVKAGLELCYMAGEILVEAADQSQNSGLTGHGSVDPWKLVVKADGQIGILGYGVPRPEIEAFLDDETRTPAEDALRYCSPEDLKPDGEPDLSSDLFALSLIALELMVGRPVYDGLVSDVKQQAQRGEAARKLYQWRERLPAPVREVLGKALKPDPDTRYRDGLDYVYSVHDLLGGIDAGEGPSLREVVTMVRARQKRGTAAVGGNTGALTREELAELAADIDAHGVATDLPAPRQPRPVEESAPEERPRWGPATRNRTEGRRGPRRPRTAKPAPEAQTTAPNDAGGTARDRLLRRLRERGQTDGPKRRESPRAAKAEEPTPPAAQPVEKTAEEAPRTGRRRRPGGRAAALLERLRSSSGETLPPVPPAEGRRRARPRKSEPASPTLAPAPPVSPPIREPAPPKVEAPAEQPTPVRAEPAPRPSTKELTVSHEGRSVVVAARGSAARVAEEAARALLLPGIDAMGRRVAAFRLGVEGRGVPAAQPATELPDEVHLRVLQNQPRLTLVKAPGGIQTRIALGAAVPLHDLRPVLAGLFGISGSFSIHAGRRELSGEEVLAELDANEIEIRT